MPKQQTNPASKKPVDVIGCFESVSIKSLGVNDVIAKVDTGAYSGALHCTSIKVVRNGLGRKKSLRFTPLGDKKLTTETSKFWETYVRSASGHRSRRYIIETDVTIHGKDYRTMIGLSNRSDMKREVLLGRRFLRENGIVVDVRINQEMDDEGNNTK